MTIQRTVKASKSQAKHGVAHYMDQLAVSQLLLCGGDPLLSPVAITSANCGTAFSHKHRKPRITPE